MRARASRLTSASLAAAAAVVPVALAASAPPVLPSVRASRAEIPLGRTVRIQGALAGLSGPVSGQLVELEASPYPYRRFRPIAHVLVAGDGSFSFARLKPDRNTRYRVVTAGPAALASRPVLVTVDALVRLSSVDRGPGRTVITLQLRHSSTLASPPVAVWWFVASGRSRNFHLVARTVTRELDRRVTYATATVNPPARQFGYRVCLIPAWEHAMGPAPFQRSCPHHDFRLRHGEV